MKYICFAITLIIVAVDAAPSKNSTKIVGGTYANNGQYPYTASLKNGNYGLICTGSIINNRWILTAAHCYSTVMAYIGVGNVYLTNQFHYQVNRQIQHPSYSGLTVFNDIMLVKSTTTILFTSTVQPIKYNTNQYDLIVSNMVASGWGQTTAGQPNPYGQASQLFYLYFNMQTPTTCFNINSQSGSGLPYDTKLQICALGQYYYTGVCFGDSGGPLVYNGIQYGITSRLMNSYGCASGYPDVFTKVSAYTIWISQIVTYY